MVQEPARRQGIGESLRPESFGTPVHQVLAQALFDAPDGQVNDLRERVADDDEAAQLLMRLAFGAPPVTDRDKDRSVDEAVRFLAHTEPAAAERRRVWEAIQAAQASGDEGEMRRLQAAYAELIVAGRRSR
jgi:hypothetical protein